MNNSLITSIDLNFVAFYPDDIQNLTNDDLKKLLCFNGPIAVGIPMTRIINFNNSKLQNQVDFNLVPNIFNYIMSAPSDISDQDFDHGVLLIGYSIDKNNKPFWIFLNSWTENWGLNGAFAVYMSNSPKNFFNEFFFIDFTNYKIDINIPKYESFNNQAYSIDISKFSNYYIPSLQATMINPKKYGFGYKQIKLNNKLLLSSSFAIKNVKNLPNEFNQTLSYSTTHNPIKCVLIGIANNQGQCGDCWLYSSTQMLAAAISHSYYLAKSKNHFVPLNIEYYKNILKTYTKCLINSNNLGCILYGQQECNGSDMVSLAVLINGYFPDKYGFNLEINKLNIIGKNGNQGNVGSNNNNKTNNDKNKTNNDTNNNTNNVNNNTNNVNNDTNNTNNDTNNNIGAFTPNINIKNTTDYKKIINLWLIISSIIIGGIIAIILIYFFLI